MYFLFSTFELINYRRFLKVDKQVIKHREKRTEIQLKLSQIYFRILKIFNVFVAWVYLFSSVVFLMK